MFCLGIVVVTVYLCILLDLVHPLTATLLLVLLLFRLGGRSYERAVSPLILQTVEIMPRLTPRVSM